MVRMAGALPAADALAEDDVSVRSALSIVEAIGVEGIENAAPEWRDLVAVNAMSCATRPEWALAWCKTIGQGAGLRVGLAYDGDRLVGVLPLMRCGARRYELLGDVHSIERGLLLHPEHAEAALRRLVDWAGARARTCDLVHLPVESALYRALRRMSNGRGVRLSEEDLPAGYCIEVDEPFEVFLSAQSKNFRTAIRQARSKARRFDIRVTRLRTVTELEDALPALRSVSTASWQGQHGTGAFSDPASLALYTEASRLFAEAGDLELYLCTVGDEPAGYVLNLRTGDRLDSLKSEHDPQYDKMVPGRQIYAAMMQDAWESGVRTIHLGNHYTRFKRDWGSRRELYASLRLYGQGLLGSLSWAGEVVRVAIHRARGRRGRRCLPQTV